MFRIVPDTDGDTDMDRHRYRYRYRHRSVPERGRLDHRTVVGVEEDKIGGGKKGRGFGREGEGERHTYKGYYSAFVI